jgi:Spy/CpxP family protein refolding chaperone
MNSKKLLIFTFAAMTLMGSAIGIAVADQNPSDGTGIGPWMMGPGMMGPGMMGPGMMGPGMMGPGMMGPGMMGPGMMGPGMMGMGQGMGPLWMLDLNVEQKNKIAKIQQEARKKQWDLMAKMDGEYVKLRELYFADKRDSAAIGSQYQKIYDLRRQMMELWVDTANHTEEVLTKEQKEKLRSFGPGWMMWD